MPICVYIYIYRYVRICSPHLCVGFLFLILYPGPAASRSHTLFTHNFVTHYTLFISLSHTTLPHTHTQLSLTTLSHTLFDTQLCHTPLSHTTLSRTIFHHTQLFHRPSFTHTTLSHTLFRTPLYQRLSFTQLCHTLSFTHNFVTHHLSHTTALHDIHLHFAWQAWHFTTSTFILRGRSGTYGTGLAPVASFAAALCVSGVALGAGVAVGGIVFRGSRGTWRHPPSFCMAGVALHDIQPSGWLRWRAWTPLVAR